MRKSWKKRLWLFLPQGRKSFFSYSDGIGAVEYKVPLLSRHVACAAHDNCPRGNLAEDFPTWVRIAPSKDSLSGNVLTQASSEKATCSYVLRPKPEGGSISGKTFSPKFIATSPDGQDMLPRSASFVSCVFFGDFHH